MMQILQSYTIFNLFLIHCLIVGILNKRANLFSEKLKASISCLNFVFETNANSN